MSIWNNKISTCIWMIGFLWNGACVKNSALVNKMNTTNSQSPRKEDKSNKTSSNEEVKENHQEIPNKTTIPNDIRNKLREEQNWDYYLKINELNKLKVNHPIIVALKEGSVILRDRAGNFLETNKREDYILTPNYCMKWNYKEFGRKQEEPKMGHLGPNKPLSQQGTGLLPYAIRGLLALENKNLDVIIISTGRDDALGVSEAAKICLDGLVKYKTIKEFYILNSKVVPKKHIECVKKNYKVGTLIHTTC